MWVGRIGVSEDAILARSRVTELRCTGWKRLKGPRGRTGIFTWYDASGQRGQ
ncbi:Uncharacterised protein [Corynebacterium renale]|nr:Uncharacterised protein [Corynebacterium renale]STC95440.1 Uncharacterised protein [Corynebacterium renale]